MSNEMVSDCCGAKTKEHRYYETVGKREQRYYETICTECGNPCEVVPKEEQPQMVRCPTTQGKNCDSCFESGEHPAHSCKTITRLPTCPACVSVEPADEALQKQHEQWLKDQEFYQQDVDMGHPYDQSDLDDSKPAVKPENPYNEASGIVMDAWQEGFAAGRASIPSKEEIAKAIESKLFDLGKLQAFDYADELAEAIHNLMGGK
jgi:hypothetical protein